MRLGIIAIILIVSFGITFSDWSTYGAEPTVEAAKASQQMPEQIDFGRDIRPILSDKCFRCHGPDETDRQADLRLDDRDDAVSDRGGYAAIKPGSLDLSETWNRINSTDPDSIMPPPHAHKELTTAEIALLGRWIREGAEYAIHWSFQPVSPKQPTGKESPIDYFLNAAIANQGLTTAEVASPEVLLRRVTLDLTGLPPTPEQRSAFLTEVGERGWRTAYVSKVDQLLQSPHYGERMTLDWMDAARYGDTSVFHADGPRDMWAWRDWVIEAFNSNLPYDEFTVKQLAGDLLPNSSIQDKIATAFHRNNATTDEGGVIAEEYRVEYAVDRVKTTSMIWMGLSMECAQCHDHKYDPISQQDYYKFFAFFNQSADPGMQTRKGNQTPTIDVPKPDVAERSKELENRIASIEGSIQTLRDGIGDDFRDWVVAAEKDAGVLEPPADYSHYFPLNPPSDPANESKDVQLLDAANPSVVGRFADAKFEDGHSGKAILTDSKRFAAFPDTGDFERDQSFSYGGWIKPNSNGSRAIVAKMNDANSHRGWDLWIESGNVAAHLIHAWDGDAIKVSAKANVSPGEWHHVFVTYDGSSRASGVQLYANGKRLTDRQIARDSLKGSIRSKVPLTIGRRTSGGAFLGLIDEVRIYDRALAEDEVAKLAGADPLVPILKTPDSQRTEEQKERLITGYLRSTSEEYQALVADRETLASELESLNQPLTTVMIMNDVDAMRPTFVLKRGQYDSPDKSQPVEPDVPSFLPPLDSSSPKNRLGLARWLVDPDHPLTARVTVNRIWGIFFGRGIVESVEDFGSQGTWPTHPELLDWLASDFVSHGWDVKRLVRMLVTSDAYCRSSRITLESLENDPSNRYLARGPRFRLSGEFLRDQALAVSGLLHGKIGGPGVKPYQPPGLWNEVSLDGGLRFKQDRGEKLYRRSMYTYWKRSAPHPTMVIFDAPTREKCTLRRGVTNTPLQALALLNDPQFVEAARFLAERVMKESKGSIREQAGYLYRAVTSREADAKILDVLEGSYLRELTEFQGNPERASQLLSVGDKPRDESLDVAEHAAWTFVCNLVLNLDETITRW